MIISNKLCSLFAASCLALVSCGGGSDSGESMPGGTVLTGILIDSEVSGVNYRTDTLSGMTNTAGEFNYIQGEMITFSIGSLEFPPTQAAALISPIELAASSANPTVTSTNIARLLQSLDDDGDPENGITILSSAAVMATPLDFTLSEADFETNTDVLNLVGNSGSVTMALVPADQALAHLNATLGITDPGPGDIVLDLRGTTWRHSAVTGCDGLADVVVITYSQTGLSAEVSRAEDKGNGCLREETSFPERTFVEIEAGIDYPALLVCGGDGLCTQDELNRTLDLAADDPRNTCTDRNGSIAVTQSISHVVGSNQIVSVSCDAGNPNTYIKQDGSSSEVGTSNPFSVAMLNNRFLIPTPELFALGRSGFRFNANDDSRTVDLGDTDGILRYGHYPWTVNGTGVLTVDFNKDIPGVSCSYSKTGSSGDVINVDVSCTDSGTTENRQYHLSKPLAATDLQGKNFTVNGSSSVQFQAQGVGTVTNLSDNSTKSVTYGDVTVEAVRLLDNGFGSQLVLLSGTVDEGLLMKWDYDENNRFIAITYYQSSAGSWTTFSEFRVDGQPSNGDSSQSGITPTITDHSLAADNSMLTVSFSVDMIDDYLTTGEYIPSRTYWQDPRTFIVEFESVQPGGSIKLIPENFISVGGQRLEVGLEVTFPVGVDTGENNDGLWLRTPASETDSGVANYSFVDGSNVTRYNGARTSDGRECFSTSTNPLVSLGNDRYRLDGSDNPVFMTITRVGETLEVTVDGEPTLIYPRATVIDPVNLALCE